MASPALAITMHIGNYYTELATLEMYAYIQVFVSCHRCVFTDSTALLLLG